LSLCSDINNHINFARTGIYGAFSLKALNLCQGRPQRKTHNRTDNYAGVFKFLASLRCPALIYEYRLKPVPYGFIT
jgi:hypothetical protein